MSANTQPLDSGAAGGMNLEGWCVLVMSALFGLFLFGVWWELRRNLRAISHQAQLRERALARFESEAAFVREMAREAASQRVAALRAASHSHLQVLAKPAVAREAEAPQAVPHALGFESVGRILERLALAAPHIEDEVPAFASGSREAFERPTLNMVRGGKASVEDEASEENDAPEPIAAVRPKKSAHRSKSRDGVKSSSMGSSAIGSGAIFASR